MMNKISLGLSISSFVLILIMFVFGNINLNFNEEESVVVEQPIYQSDLDRELSTIQSDLDRELSTVSKLIYDNSEKIKLFRKVLAGDCFEIETKLLTWKRGVGHCEGTGSVNGEIACKAEFGLILPEEIKKYNLKN